MYQIMLLKDPQKSVVQVTAKVLYYY